MANLIPFVPTAQQASVTNDLLAGNNVYVAGGLHVGKRDAIMWAALQLLDAGTIDYVVNVSPFERDWKIRKFVEDHLINKHDIDLTDKFIDLQLKAKELPRVSNKKMLVLINSVDVFDNTDRIDEIVFSSDGDEIFVFIEDSPGWTAAKYHGADNTVSGRVYKGATDSGAVFHFLDQTNIQNVNNFAVSYATTRDATI